MYKTKIFFGNAKHQGRRADTFCNEWLAGNPKIEIIDIRYAQGENGDHSICILYREWTL